MKKTDSIGKKIITILVLLSVLLFLLFGAALYNFLFLKEKPPNNEQHILIPGNETIPPITPLPPFME